MISRKIDLTEDNQFSGGRSLGIDTPISRHLFLKVRELGETMSTDDYEKLVVYERFFGTDKIHFSDADAIFNKERQFNDELRTHCLRCGKELRMPWKIRHGLCIACDEVTSIGSKFPWYELKMSEDRRDAREIFNMR